MIYFLFILLMHGHQVSKILWGAPNCVALKHKICIF